MGIEGHPSEVLCCCEYINAAGEKSHMITCCCNCEALDSACDKCITCRALPSNEIIQFITVCEDRCRVPWCSGKGAFSIRLDVAMPIFLVPSCLVFATLNWTCTLLGLAAIPSALFLFHRLWSQAPGRRRSKLFYVWGISSSLFMFCTFETVVIGYREVLLWENMLLITLFVLLMFMLKRTKQNPGFLATGQFVQGSMDGSGDHSVLNVEEDRFYDASAITWVDSRPIKGGKLSTWCTDCQVMKTPRSGHCPICEACVHGRDHHCVWIDGCVGAYNHQSFFTSLVLFVISAFYGSHLTFTTICTPTMYADWFLVPLDCRFLYADFPTALAFVCGCYSLAAGCLMAVLLLHQCLLISQNLTSQELHTAHRRGWTVAYLFAKNNTNNRGLLQNWILFLSGRRKLSATYLI
ncbi:hypothetical protein CAPTEDRAFT_173805 [Capitella teleta]|uniref:Palmitoyltransferase n=1 Tax=Capitella teleta TaxID=283909 RepID=R7U447_CAPTE|nr:hypothetical protein CAPTEDRAFT_173805 [Capitella teleta]|eukprot:ELT97935.1 hypothetical protein CAPTEDRAFT_173805 [Capitella teleta]